MGSPRFGSVNIVVADVVAASTFLEALGVELEPTLDPWAPHHRTTTTDAGAFDVDLDSSSFATWWGGAPAEGTPAVVANLWVDRREDVDALHARAVELGATELKAPWDAFWGSRYAAVRGPGPICLGIMSEPDPTRRTAPPPIDDFA